MNKLEGTLVYVMLDKPRDCFDKEKGQEYKCGIVLTDEDVVDQFNDTYPKQAAKKVKAADFEAQYKCPVPEGAGKNVWVITLKKNTKLANGNPVPDKYLPKLFIKKGDDLVDVTKEKLPANGSKGAISIDHYEGKMGNVARLKNVLVTELIEYERKEGDEYNPGDEFSSSSKPTSTPAAKPKAKVQVEADSSESPF